jgi:hypothetical protein
MKKTAGLIDRMAVSGSMLCLFHCLALPLLLTMAPFVAVTFLADEQFHWVMLALVLPLSLTALFVGCRRHNDKAVLGLIVAGLLSLIVAALLGHELMGEAGEKGLTAIGSVVLALGHLRNLRLTRQLHHA